MRHIVEKRYFWFLLSFVVILPGMISLATTKIIAPAAKPRPHGRSMVNVATAATPRSPPIGSTRPVAEGAAGATEADNADRNWGFERLQFHVF